MSYIVYMLQCSNKSYYTGYTIDLCRRLATHQRGLGSKYVYAHRPFTLVYQEAHHSKSSAMKREYQIKQLAHWEKKALINNG